MPVLAVIVWSTLTAIAVVFLRIALRSDAGFGAVGRRQGQRSELSGRGGVAQLRHKLPTPLQR